LAFGFPLPLAVLAAVVFRDAVARPAAFRTDFTLRLEARFAVRTATFTVFFAFLATRFAVDLAPAVLAFTVDTADFAPDATDAAAPLAVVATVWAVSLPNFTALPSASPTIAAVRVSASSSVAVVSTRSSDIHAPFAPLFPRTRRTPVLEWGGSPVLSDITVTSPAAPACGKRVAHTNRDTAKKRKELMQPTAIL
jgi:hypothetical protein